MNVYEPGQRRRSKARERAMARQHRTHTVSSATSAWRERMPSVAIPGVDASLRVRAGIFIRDLWWYARHTRAIQIAILVVFGLAFIFFTGSHVVAGRIFPNVWSAGIPLGGKTIEEAVGALANAWENEITIKLVDEERTWEVKPGDLGMHIDMQQTAEAARNVGMAGIPFGWAVPPVVSVDFNTAQNYLLNLTEETDIPPFNAGYEWKNGQVVGVPGRNGRMLDVAQVMDVLTQHTVKVVESRRLDMIMSALPPDVKDPEPYLEDAQKLVAEPFTLYGYDPFEDETVSWSTSQEVFTSWLEAGETGLTLRDETYSVFMEAQIRSLNPSGETQRYLDPIDTKAKLRNAIANQSNNAMLRIRYRPTTYQIQSGDGGYRIARKTGIPFFEIEAVNPAVDWNNLSIGQVIQLPSRDVTVKLDPVPNKRIVVNLNNQTLAAFEDGQLKFSWLISSGMDQYPTSPGIYQILNHEEVALGSSFTLCAEGGGSCGQWEMNWFMGMYEVGPGLMNGFHGGVLLPNGSYLGGGGVGVPYTYGCVMSRDDQGKLLYEWADDGTMVEILSNEFAPTSELGQMMWEGQFPVA